MRTPRDTPVRGYVTMRTYSLFAKECADDGESQSIAIDRMIRNRTAYRNGTCRRNQAEGLKRPQSSPEVVRNRPMHLPGGRVNYGSAYMRV